MDVFLFGAGLSKFLNPDMPLMKDLGELIKNSQISLPAVPVEFEKGLNAEVLLSHLSEELPWEPEELVLRKKAAFIEISKFIGSVITEKQSEFDKNFPDYLKLFALQILKRKAVLITLNYDTILEQFIDFAHYQTPEGGAPEWWSYYQLPLTLDSERNNSGSERGIFPPHFSSTKILKLHGSINWLYSGRSSFYGETIYLENSDKSFFQVRGNHLTRDKVPLIIPPTFSKSSFFNNETIKLLWRIAGDELSHCKRVIFFGYSFPESDSVVKTLVSQKLAEDTEMVVVDIDESIVERVKRLFPGKKIQYFDSSDKTSSGFFEWYVALGDSNKIYIHPER